MSDTRVSNGWLVDHRPPSATACFLLEEINTNLIYIYIDLYIYIDTHTHIYIYRHMTREKKKRKNSLARVPYRVTFDIAGQNAAASDRDAVPYLLFFRLFFFVFFSFFFLIPFQSINADVNVDVSHR